MNHINKKLKNGVNVILLPRSDSQAVTIYVMAGLGSDYETKDNNGISHFLEHMVMKGSSKWPEKLSMAKELESLGARYNAMTSRDCTSYFMQVPFENWKGGLDVLADVYQRPTLLAEEIENECRIITEEIKKNEDNNVRHAYDLARQLTFNGLAFGRPNIGTEKNINRITRDDLLDIHKNYSVGSTAIVVSGNINENDIDLIDNNFSILLGTKPAKLDEIDFSQDSARQKICFRETRQSNIVLGLKSFKDSDSRSPATSVIESILSGGFSSRLFERIREEKGLVYAIKAYNRGFSNYGFFHIYAGVDNSRLTEAIEAIVLELKKLKEEKVSIGELEKAKKSLIGRTLVNLDDSQYACHEYAWRNLYSQPFISPKDWLEKIRLVTIDDIIETANELFLENNLNLSVVGPFQDEGQFLPLFKL